MDRKCKTLIVAEEAGAGALLSSLLRDWGCLENYAVLASPVAAQFFSKVETVVVDRHCQQKYLETLFSEMSPLNVITGASIGFGIEKKVTTIAQGKGINVDAYIDHYWNLWQRFLDLETGKRWAVMPDRIFVPELECEDHLKAAGCPVPSILKYNHPLLSFEKLTTRSNGVHNKQQLKSEMKIPSEAIVALFVSEYLFESFPGFDWDQPSDEEFNDLLNALLLISSEMKGKSIYILVRCHPNENSNKWNPICNSIVGAKWINVSSMDKESLFAVCDMVFGLNSMLLLEAIASGLSVYSFHERKNSNGCWLSKIRPEIKELSSREEMSMLFDAFPRGIA